MHGIQTTKTVQGHVEGWDWAYPFSVAVVGDRQERRAGGLLLWRYFLIDKSRTPSVKKMHTLKKDLSSLPNTAVVTVPKLL